MGQRNVQLSDRDLDLLTWIGEQYTCRADLLAVLMARARATTPKHDSVAASLLAW